MFHVEHFGGVGEFWRTGLGTRHETDGCRFPPQKTKKNEKIN